MTQMVAQIETALAVSLLERRRTGTYLTTLGSVLLPRVQRLFAHIQSALCDPAIGASLSGRETTKSVENKITDTHIRALTAIAECGSFEAAARRLNISQPALHRSARDLERVVRRSLYQRMARGLAPTSQARELARRLKVALRELEYGIDEIRTAQGIFTARITVGNIPHSGTHLLSKAITQFLALYPAAFVHVLDGPYEPLLDALRAGDLDLLFGVLRRPAWASDVREEFLFSNPYVVVVRRQHPLARVRNITLRDLAGYDWILPARGAPRREAFERLFAGSARSPIVGIETTSPAIYKSVLATTDRIALLSTLEATTLGACRLDRASFRVPCAGQSGRSRNPSGLAADPFASKVSRPPARGSAAISDRHSDSACASPVTRSSMSRNPFDRGDPAMCGVRITLSNASNSSSSRPGSS